MRFAMIMSMVAFGGLSAAALAAPATSVRKVMVKKTIARDGTVKTVVTEDPTARAIVASCGNRRFETSAEVGEQGRKRLIKIKLCAKPGADQTTWVRTLRDAASSIKGKESLPAESRMKIVADIDAEIARVEAGTAAVIMEGPPK